MDTARNPVVLYAPIGQIPDPTNLGSPGAFFKPAGVSGLYICDSNQWIPIGGVPAILQDPVFYVDPVSGNDNNSGTISSPFATINHALQVLSVGWFGTATVNLRAGTSTLGNNTVIPQGRGNSSATAGGIVINGVDNAQDPIGPRTASGGTAGVQVAFGTVVDSVGGLVSNAHRGKFLRFTSGAILNGLSFLIEGNSTTTFTVEGSMPTAPTTETFVVETPAATISWPGTQAFIGLGSILGLQNVILSGGGGGSFVFFTGLTVGVQRVQMLNFGSSGITMGDHSSLINLTALAPQIGSLVIPNQCGCFYNFNAAISLVSTARMSVSTSLFQDVRVELLQLGFFQALDSTFRGNAYVRAVSGGSISFDRFHFDTVTPAPTSTKFIGGFGAAIVASKGSTLSVLHGDISNTPNTTAPGDAVLVEDKSSAEFSNMTGTGNAGVGARITRLSEAVEDKSSSTITLTGTLGNIKVGQLAPSAWPVSATTTDATELCVVVGV